MPAILPPTAYDAWLDAAAENLSKLAPLLARSRAEMQARAVSDFVNSPAHDSPRCIEAA